MAQNGCFSTLHPKDQRKIKTLAIRRREEIGNYPAEVTLKVPSVRRGTARIIAVFTEEGVRDARTGHPII